MKANVYQEMADEIKRLNRVINQMKSTLDDNLRKYLRQKDDLRDANIYIGVLEDEALAHLHEIESLQKEVSKYEDA